MSAKFRFIRTCSWSKVTLLSTCRPCEPMCAGTVAAEPVSQCMRMPMNPSYSQQVVEEGTKTKSHPAELATTTGGENHFPGLYNRTQPMRVGRGEVRCPTGR